MTVVKTCVLGFARIVNFHRKLGGNAWYQMTSCSVYKLRELPRGGTRYSGAVWASVFWVVSNCIVYALLCIFFYYCCCFSSFFAVLLNHFYPNSWVLHLFFFPGAPPHPPGGKEWVRSCVVLSCWMWLNHNILLQSRGVYFKISFRVHREGNYMNLFPLENKQNSQSNKFTSLRCKNLLTFWSSYLYL